MNAKHAIGMGLLLALPWLGGCAPMLGVVGVSTVSSPLLQVATMIDRFKLAGDGVSFFSSGKTISDHVLSAAVNADCRLLNIVKDNVPVCSPKFVVTDAAEADMVAGAEADGHADPAESLAEADGEEVAEAAEPESVESGTNAPEPLVSESAEPPVLALNR